MKFSARSVAAVLTAVALSTAGLTAVAIPTHAAQAVTCGGIEWYNIDQADIAEQKALAEAEAVRQCEAAGYTSIGNERSDAYLQTTWPEGDDVDRTKYYVQGYADGIPASNPDSDCEMNSDGQLVGDDCDQAVEFTPPPPCWSAEAPNCPVGGAMKFAAPEYALVGQPLTLKAYAAWQPAGDSPAQPTDGTAVIYLDGEPWASAPFESGVATFRGVPQEAGLKQFTVSGVLNSGISGASAWIDTVQASIMVLPYDPNVLSETVQKWNVDVGETFTLEHLAQAKTKLGKRVEWRVAEESKDVCAIYETKKGAVKAKFTDSGRCSVIWMDPKTDDEGNYSFVAQ